MVRDARPEDTGAFASIYNHYIEHAIATFEEVQVSAEEMAQRFQTITEKLPWLSFEAEGAVLGYAYASPWNVRHSYRYSAESTVYLAPDAVGKGIGTQLYGELINRLQGLGFHTVIGGISLPNTASVRLHESCGFRKVSHYREVGWKFDRWIDVGYWQRML